MRLLSPRVSWPLTLLASLGGASAGCAGEQAAPSACAAPVGDSATRGPADAPVTIVQFADFQCPFCQRSEATVAQVDEAYPDEIRWVYKHAPSTRHPQARNAAIASECAHDQGQFWEMAALLYENQSSLSSSLYAELADTLELDVATWQDCYDRRATGARVDDDIELALSIGLGSTPTFFINGAPLVGALPLSSFRREIDRALTAAEQSDLEGESYYDSLVDEGCE